MNQRREYEIAFVGLKLGTHEFKYRVEDKFFASYGEQDFSNCQADVKLMLDKHSGFMILQFDIDGTTEVSCDRCGNPLVIQLWEEFKIVVKMAEDTELMNEQEEDPDVYYMSKTESHLYVGDWIYEFVMLSIPNQKLCKDDAQGNSGCNKEVLEKLKQMEENLGREAKPIWKGLDKFKESEE